jgi:hypothetical protein
VSRFLSSAPSLFAVIFALASLLSGCGSSSTPQTPTLALGPASAAVALSQTEQFVPTTNLAMSALSWQVNGVQGGNSTVGTITSTGLYTAPSSGNAQTVTVSVTDTNNTTVTATAQVYVTTPGAVNTTANGQVGAYVINLPSTGTASVQFGTDTNYGRSTWKVSSPTGGGLTTILVAGMLENTTYHMRANVTLSDGTTYDDSDRTFTTTQSVPTIARPTLTITTPGTPQPGVELLTDLYRGAMVYDLQGRLLWAYPATDWTGNYQIQPVKLMSNGHILIQVGAPSTYPLGEPNPTPPANTLIEVREVDLANTTIHSLTLATLQTQLNNFGYKNDQGNLVNLLDMHHEVTINPDTGHWLVLANSVETKSGLTGYTSPVPVLGDIIMDVDPNNNFAVDWVWNEFDHLDVNRHPYMFPDWTHTNAIVYSADDHNILVSSRHQSWVMKVNYLDASGNGDILWRLGYQGDFTLENGTDPQDWQYAQHEPSFTTSNTTGTFGLIVMDNGDSRVFPSGYQCGVGTNLPCTYSRTPIFTINETAKTATLSNAAIGPIYNSFGGNAEVLANGNVEGDYCGGQYGSTIYETTQSETPQTVWSMNTGGTFMYRAHRLGSLYPGVQW